MGFRLINIFCLSFILFGSVEIFSMGKKSDETETEGELQDEKIALVERNFGCVFDPSCSKFENDVALLANHLFLTKSDRVFKFRSKRNENKSDFFKTYFPGMTAKIKECRSELEDRSGKLKEGRVAIHIYFSKEQTYHEKMADGLKFVTENIDSTFHNNLVGENFSSTWNALENKMLKECEASNEANPQLPHKEAININLKAAIDFYIKRYDDRISQVKSDCNEIHAYHNELDDEKKSECGEKIPKAEELQEDIDEVIDEGMEAKKTRGCKPIGVQRVLFLLLAYGVLKPEEAGEESEMVAVPLEELSIEKELRVDTDMVIKTQEDLKEIVNKFYNDDGSFIVDYYPKIQKAITISKENLERNLKCLKKIKENKDHHSESYFFPHENVEKKITAVKDCIKTMKPTILKKDAKHAISILKELRRDQVGMLSTDQFRREKDKLHKQEENINAVIKQQEVEIKKLDGAIGYVQAKKPINLRDALFHLVQYDVLCASEKGR